MDGSSPLLPLCKNVVYTSMRFMHAGLCYQDLHSGEYLAELQSGLIYYI